MKYVEFTVMTTAEAEETVADIFWKYTDYGVAISSFKDILELTENRRTTFDYIDENILKGNDKISYVKGYFPIDEAQKYLKLVNLDLNTLKHNSQGYIDVGTLEVASRIVENDDWIEIWRKHFRPKEFSKIVVCPEWIKCQTKKELVLIGSNMAFGTGEHETTSLCIKFLEKYVKEGQTVIDVGTGSGILGIAAAKLGAASVYMTDNDEKAVKAAEYNIKINGVEKACKLSESDLLSAMKIKGDILVANITAEILVRLSKDISLFLKGNGIVILSGIINEKRSLVENAFLSLGFITEDAEAIGEWTALVMKKQ